MFSLLFLNGFYKNNETDYFRYAASFMTGIYK